MEPVQSVSCFANSSLSSQAALLRWNEANLRDFTKMSLPGKLLDLIHTKRPELYPLMGPLLHRWPASSSLWDESCPHLSVDGSFLPPEWSSSDAACFFVERPSLWLDALLLAPSATRARSSAC